MDNSHEIILSIIKSTVDNLEAAGVEEKNWDALDALVRDLWGAAKKFEENFSH